MFDHIKAYDLFLYLERLVQADISCKDTSLSLSGQSEITTFPPLVIYHQIDFFQNVFTALIYDQISAKLMTIHQPQQHFVITHTQHHLKKKKIGMLCLRLLETWLTCTSPEAQTSLIKPIKKQQNRLFEAKRTQTKCKLGIQR